MTVQSTYSRSFDAAFAGQPGDSGPKRDSSSTNTTGSAIPAGIFVAQAATAGELKLPDSATAKLLGVVLNSFARNPGDASVSLSGTAAIVSGGQANVRELGSVYMLSETSMAVTDKVYVRHTANGAGKLQAGAIRNTLDGVAQVTTLTPTAAQNSTTFGVRVSFADRDYAFTVVSDGSMTATEVVTSFKTAMAADTAFAARCVASGTATLVLTGQTAGEAFEVSASGDGLFSSIAATTPPAATAREVKGARVLIPSTSTAPCLIYLDIAIDRAFV